MVFLSQRCSCRTVLRFAVGHIATCFSGQCWLPLTSPFGHIVVLHCWLTWHIRKWSFFWWSLLAVWSSRWPSSTVSEGVVFVWKTGVIGWLKFFFVWQRSWPSYHFFLPVWTSCSHNSHNQSSSLLFVWETMSEWMGSSPRHFRPETGCFTLFILETCRNLWQSQVVHPGILHFDDNMILSCSSQHIWSCLPLPSHLYLLLLFQP